MPIDCPTDAHQLYCIPSAYEDAYVFSGSIIRVTPEGKRFVVSDEAFAQAGARIIIEASDLIILTSPSEDLALREVGDFKIYYRATCTGLSCKFEIGRSFPEGNFDVDRPGVARVEPSRSAKAEKGVFLQGIEIIGADERGLGKALRSVSVILPGDERTVFVPLADLAPDH